MASLHVSVLGDNRIDVVLDIVTTRLPLRLYQHPQSFVPSRL
jgi:hypothetical protein